MSAGKTGTTQSYGDAWFVGYTPRMSTAVWVGFPDGQSHALRGVHGINVTGGTLPADIWRRYMEVATKDARYRGSFHAPGELGGKLVPESGRLKDGGGSTTTSTTASTTSTTAPAGSTTTSTTEPDGATTTSSTSTPASTTTSTTTSTTVLPTG
jgi:penicillin-binding protein 1A